MGLGSLAQVLEILIHQHIARPHLGIGLALQIAADMSAEE